MMLKDKVAVIYGAAGGIGGAVARAFASEGAKVFLTGRQQASVEAVANEIQRAGGSAEAAEVDALDEQAVNEHLQSVIEQAGRVDISFNAVGVSNAKALGVPLVELDLEQFSRRHGCTLFMSLLAALGVTLSRYTNKDDLCIGTTTSERGSDSQEAHFRVIRDKQGRIMVVMTHNTDIGDSMEREAEEPEFFAEFSIGGYALATNIVLYALTH